MSKKFPSGRFRVGCDSQEAICKLQPTYCLTVKTPDYDIAHSIRHIIAKTGWDWHIKHVYGHQDKGKRYDKLDLWARLNVDCDTAAKLFCEQAEQNQTNFCHLPLY